MNFHAMMKEYKTVDVQSKVEKDNPQEFIKIVKADKNIPAYMIV